MRARIPGRLASRPLIVSAAVALAAATASLTGASPAAAQTYTSLPAHVYAPYYETYLAPNTPGTAPTTAAPRSPTPAPTCRRSRPTTSR